MSPAGEKPKRHNVFVLGSGRTTSSCRADSLELGRHCCYDTRERTNRRSGGRGAEGGEGHKNKLTWVVFYFGCFCRGPGTPHVYRAEKQGQINNDPLFINGFTQSYRLSVIDTLPITVQISLDVFFLLFLADNAACHLRWRFFFPSHFQAAPTASSDYHRCLPCPRGVGTGVVIIRVFHRLL